MYSVYARPSSGDSNVLPWKPFYFYQTNILVMRLDEFLDDFKVDAEAQRRQLAKDKSYEILDHLDVDEQFDSIKDTTHVGRTSPSIFVGRSSYPNVSTGILAPVDPDANAGSLATSGEWYNQDLGIENVLQNRTGLLNSNRSANVDVHDVWDGFVGVQREVALADRPVGVEMDLADSPTLDLGLDEVSTPTGPRASAKAATLTENPHIPKQVDKVLEDDDWQAQGAINHLYNRGFDVYEINNILSAGALGKAENRKLVPTRWSITAVDDTIGKFLHGGIRNNPSIDTVQVWENTYMGNRYWVILTPGKWEYELVEMKSPGSIWNPNSNGEMWMTSASEGFEGRTQYVDETSGAYYAARLGVLEHFDDIGRQGKALVLREVSDDYWAPVGVWQIRESIRNAFDGEPAHAETFHQAVNRVSELLPVSLNDLRRKSSMVSGIQSTLSGFDQHK